MKGQALKGQGIECLASMPRMVVAGPPYQVTQRGNRREPIFLLNRHATTIKHSGFREN